MPKSDEVIIEYEEGFPPEKHPDCQEDVVDVPMESINTDTLRNLIAEFVTREWERNFGGLDLWVFRKPVGSRPDRRLTFVQAATKVSKSALPCREHDGCGFSAVL